MSKQKKYVIRIDPEHKDVWARVPYGSYRRFDTYEQAVAWLQYRYEEKKRKSKPL